jgi:hypothetical protein
MKITLLAIAVIAAPLAAQTSVSVDLSGYAKQSDMTALQSAIDAKPDGSAVYTKPQVDGLVAPGAAAAPFARTKWAGAGLATDATGARTIAVPAGRMSTGVVCNITIRTTGAFATPTCVPTGTPATGYNVAVTFTKLKQAITIPAVVVGAAATTLPILEPMASTGVVVFDIAFSEPDVVGP